MEEKIINVSTVEELRKAINENENCTIVATKELEAKLDRSMSTDLRKPPEDMDLFFEMHTWIDKMSAKNIRYTVEEESKQ